MNAEKAPGRYERPWVLQGKETTKLAQNAQTSHFILSCECYVGPDNGVSNDGVVRLKV